MLISSALWPPAWFLRLRLFFFLSSLCSCFNFLTVPFILVISSTNSFIFFVTSVFFVSIFVADSFCFLIEFSKNLISSLIKLSSFDNFWTSFSSFTKLASIFFFSSLIFFSWFIASCSCFAAITVSSFNLIFFWSSFISSAFFSFLDIFSFTSSIFFMTSSFFFSSSTISFLSCFTSFWLLFLIDIFWVSISFSLLTINPLFSTSKFKYWSFNFLISSSLFFKSFWILVHSSVFAFKLAKSWSLKSSCCFCNLFNAFIVSFDFFFTFLASKEEDVLCANVSFIWAVNSDIFFWTVTLFSSNFLISFSNCVFLSSIPFCFCSRTFSMVFFSFSFVVNSAFNALFSIWFLFFSSFIFSPSFLTIFSCEIIPEIFIVESFSCFGIGVEPGTFCPGVGIGASVKPPYCFW